MIIKSVFLGGLLLISGCTTFRDRNGKKFRQFAMASDYSKEYFSKNNQHSIRDFNLDNYLSKPGINNIEYFTPEAYIELQSKHSKFFVLYWNAACIGDRKDSLARQLELKGIPVILVSYSFGVSYAQKKIKESGLSNRTVYILSPKQKTNKSIFRILNFTKNVCDSCYSIYKDELMFSEGLYYNQGSTQVLFYPDLKNLTY